MKPHSETNIATTMRHVLLGWGWDGPGVGIGHPETEPSLLLVALHTNPETKGSRLEWGPRDGFKMVTLEANPSGVFIYVII